MPMYKFRVWQTVNLGNNWHRRSVELYKEKVGPQAAWNEAFDIANNLFGSDAAGFEITEIPE